MNLIKPFGQKQHGATLLVSLLLLLMLTVLAISSARTSVLQQRATSNLQQKSIAFQMADNGSAAAILRLTNDKPKPDGTKTFCAEISSTLPDWNAACPSSQQFYHVEVTKVDCDASDTNPEDNSSIGAGIKPVGGDAGGCYKIISSGHFNGYTVKHLQGVRFSNKK